MLLLLLLKLFVGAELFPEADRKLRNVLEPDIAGAGACAEEEEVAEARWLGAWRWWKPIVDPAFP